MKLHIHTMWGESNWLDMPAPIFDNEDLGNIWYLTKTRTFLFQRRMICRIKQAIWVKQNAKSTFASTASAYHWMKRNSENNQRFLRSQHCLTGADHLGQRIHTGGLILWALAGTDQSSSQKTLEWCFFDPRSWWPPVVYRQQGQGALADFVSLRKATLQCWYLAGEGCVGGFGLSSKVFAFLSDSKSAKWETLESSKQRLLTQPLCLAGRSAQLPAIFDCGRGEDPQIWWNWWGSTRIMAVVVLKKQAHLSMKFSN